MMNKGQNDFAQLAVLVVEDHSLQRHVLVRTLDLLGVGRVVEAEDGAQALLLLADPNSRIDIVFTDLDMPTMDGLALMQQISKRSPDVGVVVLSSVERNLLSAVEWLAREQGIRLLALIEKPASRQSLVDALLCHIIAPPKRAPSQASFTLEEITAGLEAGQFEAFMQPQLDFANFKFAGAEALARWRHPQHGVVSPASFINTIEASELVEPFSLAILQSSAWAVKWLDALWLPGRIAINVSPTWLDQPTMAERLIQAVSRLGFPVERLTIEVTESVANSNLAAALENLARLRMAGFKLSVDDFGTGFSSLQRLMSSPFSELKLDRAFVSELQLGTPRWFVMESTITLAKRLGLTTVAEGVETFEEWQVLKDAGCDNCQGYFTAKPMAQSDFMIWAKENPNMLSETMNAERWFTGHGKLGN